MNNKLLVIGHVWPEPNSTAAGYRMLQLIEAFSCLYEIHFACAADKNENSFDFSSRDVICHFIELNDSSFNEFLKELVPGVVMFDRFLIEEQFGWRVREIIPEAITILDTEDLHFVRKRREAEVLSNKKVKADLIKQRELAAIYKSDLTIVISKKEKEELINIGVPENHVVYIPFLIDSDEIETERNYTDRSGFVSIGSFLHEPNKDAVRLLKKTVWPKIRKRLPDAELNVYGAFITQEFQQMDDPKNGFNVIGRADSARGVMRKSRISLAPLRFGAGMKGKILDSMITGTPSITTSIGAEGMIEDSLWPGAIEDNFDEFIEKAVELYSNPTLWENCLRDQSTILKDHFNKKKYTQILLNKLKWVVENIEIHRDSNHFGEILKFNQYNSTKFMSKWIEAKNS